MDNNSLVEIEVIINGDTIRRTIQRVRFVPNAKFQLLSEVAAFEAGCEIVKTQQGITIQKDGVVLVEAIKETGTGGLFKVHQPTKMVMLNHDSDTLNSLHLKLNHMHPDKLKRMIKEGKREGVNLTSDVWEPCDGCKLGKMSKVRHQKKSNNPAKEPGDRISADYAGPVTPQTAGGGKYVSMYTDEASGYVDARIFPDKSSSRALEHFKEFKALLENQTGKNIKVLRSDNGECCSKQFEEFLKAEGIVHETTAPHTPQDN